jgi:hypothetical protein
VQKLKFCTCFASMKTLIKPSKVGYFSKITEIFSGAQISLVCHLTTHIAFSMFSILVTNLCSVVNRKAQSCQSSSWLHSSKNPVRFFCPAVHCLAVQRFESWHGCFASWTARKQLKITAQQPLIYHYCLPQTASMHLKTMHYSFTTLFFTLCFYVLQNQGDIK